MIQSPGRRGVLQGALVMGVALPFGRANAADDAPLDIGVACEPPVQAAMRAVAEPFSDRTHTPMVVLAAPAGLIVAQVKRHTRTDVLILPSDAMDEASRHGLIRPETRRHLAQNPLVFAARHGFGQAPADADALLRQLGEGWLAATDPTSAATFDGTAALDRLGLLQPLAGRLMGAANAGDVAFLLRSGAARFGLLPRSAVQADPNLVVALVTNRSDLPPDRIEMALNHAAQSPRAKAFLDFLATPEAAAHLRAAGLETAV